MPKQYTADYALDWTYTKRQHCSTATITGNLQSIVIGNLSGIGFVPFLQARWILSLLSLLIAWAIVAIVYRNQLASYPLIPSITLPPLYAPRLRCRLDCGRTCRPTRYHPRFCHLSQNQTPYYNR
ncbi:MAG: hypothetical protein ACO3F2_02920 [Roseiflexaceae bacterium]